VSTVTELGSMHFSAPEYEGVWLSFDGDRLAFRQKIETHLRIHLNDPKGQLDVTETGPYWKGSSRIELSYSHSHRWGILVFSRSHRLGVDLEWSRRIFATSPLKIAQRFFHEREQLRLLKTGSEGQMDPLAFLDLWMKKEAYGKLTRKGLKDSIHLDTFSLTDVEFRALPMMPIDYDARIALMPGTGLSG